MRTWLVRGTVLALVHAAATVLVAALKADDPTGRGGIEALSLGLLVGIAAVWAAVDGWLGVPDRGRAWVIAALVAGVGSAILGVVGRAVLVDQTGVSALGQALTGGAAFTALLVLIPAALGLVVGPRLDSRRRGADPEDDAPPADPEPGTAGDPMTVDDPVTPADEPVTPSPAERKPSPRPRRGTRMTPRSR